ncbi:MAG: phosphoribosylformylglycinamidine cyclo-ligase [Candidatus Aminicenantes bacterium]|nr:phosphoribosylformylglycinamidine cyclo-ligase [Candidatus Aminicenantes bacterium]
MVTYKEAGVDLEKADRSVKIISSILKKYGVSSENFGLFGGIYKLSENSYLIASSDGVGTKLKIAFMSGRHNTVGSDLVNHCINDIFVHGAEPLFFLDYIAMGELDLDILASVMEGFAKACSEAGCVILGGETAEMPGFYKKGEYDLVGFIVGRIEGRIIDGRDIKEGDILIGLPSNGLHTNGYSLARKIIFEKLGLSIDSPLPYDKNLTVADELLKTHRQYYTALKNAKELIKGMAHITGGGIPGNLSRIIPKGLKATIRKDSWEVPEIFKFLVKEGNLSDEEAFRAFNMGVGMIVIPYGEEFLNYLEKRGEKFWIIGKIEKGEGVEIV